LDGTRVPRDPAAAFLWFQRAARSGDLDGRNMVGRCYEQGWGVVRKATICSFNLLIPKSTLSPAPWRFEPERCRMTGPMAGISTA
ncbi:hypothetical protein ABTE85_21995, partial [Acinetobacter baumannii]